MEILTFSVHVAAFVGDGKPEVLDNIRKPGELKLQL